MLKTPRTLVWARLSGAGRYCEKCRHFYSGSHFASTFFTTSCLRVPSARCLIGRCENPTVVTCGIICNKLLLGFQTWTLRFNILSKMFIIMNIDNSGHSCYSSKKDTLAKLLTSVKSHGIPLSCYTLYEDLFLFTGLDFSTFNFIRSTHGFDFEKREQKFLPCKLLTDSYFTRLSCSWLFIFLLM